MTAPYQPRRLAKRDLRPIVLACASIVLALALGLTVSALTLNYVFNAIMADPFQEEVSQPVIPTSTPPPTAPAETPVSAPMIKCKKTPRKKCNFVAERRKKR